MEEVIGARLLQELPGQAANGMFEHYAACVDSGTRLRLSDVRVHSEVVGTDRWFELSAIPSRDDLVLTWRDITDWHRQTEALEESEGHYRALAENASDVVYQMDSTSKCTWISPSVTEVLGWKPADLIGQRMAELLRPDDLRAAQQALAEVLVGSQPPALELRYRTADGEWRWMSAAGHVLTASDGAVLGGITALRDIHDLVIAREELARSEARYRLIAENSRDVVLQIALDGTILWASPSACGPAVPRSRRAQDPQRRAGPPSRR